MYKDSFSKAFLEILNEATIPSISGDDELSVKDQLELVRENPDIIAKMDNPDQATLKYILKNWKTFSPDDQDVIKNSKHAIQLTNLAKMLNTLAKEKRLSKEQRLANQNDAFNQNILNIIDMEEPTTDQLNKVAKNWNNFTAEEKLKIFNSPNGRDILKRIHINPKRVEPKVDNIKTSNTENILPSKYKDGMNISTRVQLSKITKNPMEILNIRNPSKEAIIAFQSLAKNGIHYLEDMNTTNVQIDNNLLRYYLNVDPNAIDYSKPQPQDDAVIGKQSIDDLYTIKDNPYNIINSKDIDFNKKKAAIKRDPNVVKDLLTSNINVEDELVDMALRRKPQMFPWFTKNNINVPYNTMYNILKKCPQLIVFMKNPSYDMFEMVLQQRPSLLGSIQDIPPSIKEKTIHNLITRYNKDDIKDLLYEDRDIIENLIKNNKDIKDDTDDDFDESTIDYSSIKNESMIDYIKRIEKIILSE